MGRGKKGRERTLPLAFLRLVGTEEEEEPRGGRTCGREGVERDGAAM